MSYVLAVITSQKSADDILRTMPLEESARLIWLTSPPVVVVMVSSPTATRADLNVLTSDATDESTLGHLKFLIHVDSTLENLQKQEDTDNNFQITIEDSGPKVLVPMNGHPTSVQLLT